MKKAIISFISAICIFSVIFSSSAVAFASDSFVFEDADYDIYDNDDVWYEDSTDDYWYEDDYHYPIYTPDLETKSQENSITLIGYGGNEYELSIYNDATGSYDVLGVSNNGKYTVKGLKSGKSYKLAARAFRDNTTYDEFNNPITSIEYSDYSYYTVCTKPASVTLKSVKYSSPGKITVKWKKNGSADGYAVVFSRSKSFKREACIVLNVGANKTCATISNLLDGKYYIAVKPYVSSNDELYYASKSNVKSVTVKKGVTVSKHINSLKLSKDAVKAVKSITKNGVNISKYKNNYDRVKAVYDWHAKHFKDFRDCVACNSSFNNCIEAMFDNKKNPEFILELEAGDVRNNDGSQVIHKWSIWYISGKPFLFDPRLQGYTGNFKGTLYFAKPKTSSLYKRMYIPQYAYFYYIIGGSDEAYKNNYTNSKDKIK